MLELYIADGVPVVEEDGPMVDMTALDEGPVLAEVEVGGGELID